MVCVCIYEVKLRPSKTACTVKTVEINQKYCVFAYSEGTGGCISTFPVERCAYIIAELSICEAWSQEPPNTGSRDCQPTNTYRPDRHAADVTRFAHWSVAQNLARPLAEPTPREGPSLILVKGVIQFLLHLRKKVIRCKPRSR